MRKASLALLVLFSGCARDLTLPPDSEDPERLGELSGVYGMSIFATIQNVPDPVEIPVQALFLVVHLDKPQGEAQPVVALIEDNIVDLEPWFSTTAVDDPALTEGRIFGGAFDGKNLQLGGAGTLSMTGEEAPGASGLTLHANDLTICPRLVVRSRGGPSDLHARRLCQFDPSISGVYRGTASSCDGQNQKASYLGVGFFEGQAVGLRYPEDTEVLLGGYNRFTGEGLGRVFPADGNPGYSQFLVSEADHKLHLDMTVSSLDSNCLEKRSMDFLGTPGQGLTCSPDLSGPALGFEPLVHVDGGGRFLDVRVFPSVDPLLTYDPSTPNLQVILNDAASDELVSPVRADQVPSGYTARFPLDTPGLLPRYYELAAVRGRLSSGQAVAELAPATCLRDRSR